MLAFASLLVSCECQRRRLPDILDPPTEQIKKGKECPPSSWTQNVSRYTYDFLCTCMSYQPEEITVSRNQTIFDAVLGAYPNWYEIYSDDPSAVSLGGGKLLGEMSADRVGHYSSYGPVSINILPLSDMHLRWIDDKRNLFFLAMEGDITLYEARIPYSLFSFRCDFDLVNNWGEYLDVVIPEGQMIESHNHGVQNVVVSRTVTRQLEPYEQTTISVPVLCASQHRGDPKGSRARLTPFMLDIPARDYQSQHYVWNDIETREVTFYAWRSGDRTQSGTSRFGHAFVRLPGVGVYGFGAQHRGKRLLLGGQGIIFDHSQLVQYATDSCRVNVTDKQMKAMVAKLNALRLDEPLYELGRYDCTSFVMDIADAGGIKYGPRAVIQWPISFIEELKAHN